MRSFYSEWNGEEFATQDHLQFFSHLLEYIIEYGEPALDALKQMELDPEQRALLEKLIDEGLLEKMGAHFRLTPRAIGSLQRKALMEVFRNLRPGGSEGHETIHTGMGGERVEGSRPYQFGDPVSELDLTATLRNALQRHGPGLPLRVGEQDFEVGLTESKATCSTVILLDMSGSMYRMGRFANAKKCAMAVYALIRQRFMLDTAEVIPEHKLPLVMPKRVSLFDSNVRMRVPISNLASAPQHFTNLHMGLVSARRVLARRGGANKQVFIITDGEPTAHVQGEYVYLLYPPDRSTMNATLGEALLMARQGIRFATFALIDDYYMMDWVGFVDRLTKLTRGAGFYCTGESLASCIMESYLSGRRRKAYIA
jgi:uncharacterized protein with von Willebrand factor type A (vWA) domain